MKILLNSGKILPFLTVRRRLLKTLMQSNCEITLTGFQTQYTKECNEFGVKYLEIPFARASLNPLQDLMQYMAYKRIMKKNKYDIVHSYTIKPNIYGSIAAKSVGIDNIFPTINGLGYSFTNVGHLSIKNRIVQTIVKVLYKKAFSCATKVFFQNPDDLSEMVKLGLIKEDKCVLISGSGIELPAYPFSIPSVKPIVFFLGSRLLITKGIREYCEAARIVKGHYPNVVFQLAGGIDPNPDGIKKEELDSHTKDGTIEYLGLVNDMVKALSNCSVFVLPSFYREGVPHAILEAMSTGRAIITCNTPGCKETIRDPNKDGQGKNGFLVEPRNSKALAETMIWMIEHANEVIQMGYESRKYAEDRFDVEKVNQKIIQTMDLQP